MTLKYKELTGNKTIVRLPAILAKLLDMDEKEIREKLKDLPQEITNVITSDCRFVITGVLEIYPVILPPGEFLHTTLKKKVQVPARVSARARTKNAFLDNCRKKRFENLDFY